MINSAKQANFSVDEYRPIKVICIGAGFSGIVAGIRFRQRIPHLNLTIYEKENGVGGTWHVNKYLGLACDIPSHAYQLSFEPNTQWSSFYAPGAEIKAYLEGVVEKYKLMPYMRLEHEMTAALWNADTAKWEVTIRRGEDGREFTDTADVLFLGIGSLNRWRWPDIDGLRSFGGALVHSAGWNVPDDVLESWKDKNVAVIGNGSTGIQLVTALQPRVKALTNFIRRKTWISTSFSVDKLQQLAGRELGSSDYSFTSEFKKKLADPDFYQSFRREVETSTHLFTAISFKDSPMQVASKVMLQQEMTRKLSRKPELTMKLLPEFAVGCRRLTPGPGYLEALCKDNVTLETTHIARVTATGVVLVDGRQVPLDVLICATGYDTSFLYPFPIIGREGMKLTDRWASHAEAYLSMAVDGFPNLWFGFGPNSALNSGSNVLSIEKQVDYAVAAVAKMQRERLRTIEVKPEALREFNEYAQEYFKKTVYFDNCSNWYRSPVDGVITGIWPGSCLHLSRVLTHPRWEDFTYERLNEDQTTNRFFWLGDGLTYAEKTLTGDRAWYLHNVDIPPVPE
ncbi:FAD/NAD-P-binding domain-containing protein [Peniophora sp. CONT]|nr:FAD/NAD-P-binding domain-containing protein [Peniophora sp. CONT]